LGCGRGSYLTFSLVFGVRVLARVEILRMAKIDGRVACSFAVVENTVANVQFLTLRDQ